MVRLVDFVPVKNKNTILPMKFKKKLISDNIGGCSLARAIAREALWGIVEKISQNEASLENIETEDVYVDVDAGLPMSFTSKSSKKRKDSRKGHADSKSKANSSLLMLPVPKYNGTLLEDHVYYVQHHASLNGALVRILGVKHHTCSECYMSARIIQCEDVALLSTTVELLRSQLRLVPAAERVDAHKMVQQDEQYVLQVGKPSDIHLKYWDQRYRLLSRFDLGIKLDSESWYSITPEAVAKHVTASCVGRARETHCKLDYIMDCFSGCGGNTIPFLSLGKKVISVDFDAKKLDYLRHNCGVYDLDQPLEHCVCADVYTIFTSLLSSDKLARIRHDYKVSLEDSEPVDSQSHSNELKAACVGNEQDGLNEGVSGSSTSFQGNGSSTGASEGIDNIDLCVSELSASEQKQQDDYSFPGSDTSEISGELKNVCISPDLIILSPPWGGPDYLNAKHYCLYTMLTSGCGLYLTMLAAAVCPNILQLLPVNTSVEQVQYIADMVGLPYVIEYVSINHTPKVMAVYMGPMVKHVHGKKRSAEMVEPSSTEDTSKHMRFDA